MPKCGFSWADASGCNEEDASPLPTPQEKIEVLEKENAELKALLSILLKEEAELKEPVAALLHMFNDSLNAINGIIEVVCCHTPDPNDLIDAKDTINQANLPQKIISLTNWIKPLLDEKYTVIDQFYSRTALCNKKISVLDRQIANNKKKERQSKPQPKRQSKPQPKPQPKPRQMVFDWSQASAGNGRD
jgi:hypothetical protein